MADNSVNDRFSDESLRVALGARPFRFYEQVGSTMDRAQSWLMESAPPDGAVVIAEEQTGGRGRQGRAWLSPPYSSLMFSVITRPTLAPEQLPRLTMAGGLAVDAVLAPLLGERFALKWPNDGLIGRKKVCGVLSEAVWSGADLVGVVVGIGLNVRVDFSGTALADVATSLETELGRQIDRRTLLADLLDQFDAWSKRATDPALVTAWRSRLGTLGRRVTVFPQQAGQTPYSGTAEAVDTLGALLVRLDEGEVRRVLAADVGLAEE